MSAPVTLHLRIVGRVQGVGYRAALQREALRRGLRGWVRNRTDGSVEAVLHGPGDACDQVLAWARRGPPAARVAAVQASAIAPASSDLPAGFECRPTA
jgi:acylphosphatase